MTPGTELGRFRLEATLADGTWRARDIGSGTTVRVRFVEPFGDEQAFVDAARSLRSVLDPGVVPVLDAGCEGGRHCWVASPWQAGETLSDRIARVGPLPPEQLALVAEGLLAGLGVAHGQGVRDGAITPERLRILGEPPTSVVLEQPGLGSLVTDLVPDPDFAPPEGSMPTVAADLYGAATTLCFAASGLSMPSGEALAAAGPRLPSNLLEALSQCLDRDPRDRPHSIGPLLRSVQSLRTRLNEPSDARPPPGVLLEPPRHEPGGAALPPATPPRRADPAAATALPAHRRVASPAAPDPAIATAPTLAATDAPAFDFSGATMAVAELDLQALTEPAAPPTMPRPGQPARVAPPAGAPVRAPAEPNPPRIQAEPELDDVFERRREARASARPEPQGAPLELDAPRSDRGRGPVGPSAAAAGATRGLWIGTGVVLLLGIGGVVLWWAGRTPHPDSTTPPPVAAAAEPTVERIWTRAPASKSMAPSTLPAERSGFVRVVPDPGPARFVQVASGEVVCEASEACFVPIDVETRVEKAGYRPTVLSGDDLYDRRGGKWTVKLYRGR